MPPEHSSAPLPWDDDDGFDWEDPAPRRVLGRYLLLAVAFAGFAAAAAQLSAGLPEYRPFDRIAERYGPAGAGSGVGPVAAMAVTEAEPQLASLGHDEPRFARTMPAARVDAPAAQRFVISADEVLGYAEGRGLSNLAYGLLEGTHCKLEPGAVIAWHRDRPGGAECRVLLFDRGWLRPGWRIERVTLRLGFGTAVQLRDDEPRPTAIQEQSPEAELVLETRLLPAQFRVMGRVPLPGARFWVALDRIELVGPGDATDWHTAFVRGVSPLD
ncbi:MAG: hypothetical protein AAGC57_02235 [Pseudomonadota bacterium]